MDLKYQIILIWDGKNIDLWNILLVEKLQRHWHFYKGLKYWGLVWTQTDLDLASCIQKMWTDGQLHFTLKCKAVTQRNVSRLKYRQTS